MAYLPSGPRRHRRSAEGHRVCGGKVGVRLQGSGPAVIERPAPNSVASKSVSTGTSDILILTPLTIHALRTALPTLRLLH